MGVRGLLSFIESKKHKASATTVDLVGLSQIAKDGVQLCVDLQGLCRWLLQRQPAASKFGGPIEGWGGRLPVRSWKAATKGLSFDYEALDLMLEVFVRGLYFVNVSAIYYVDCPPGSGLVDRCCACRLEVQRERLAHCKLPALWLEQAKATMKRLGEEVFLLSPMQQVPLWVLPPTVYAVLSDNLEWCMKPGVHVIPFCHFDLESNIIPVVKGHKITSKLLVRVTSGEQIADVLRLRSPVRADASYKPLPMQGPKFHGLLHELAIICGCDCTVPVLKKSNLLQQLQIDWSYGTPVEALAHYLHSRVYSSALTMRADFRIEDADPVIVRYKRMDPIFAQAFMVARLAFQGAIQGLVALRSSSAGGPHPPLNVKAPAELVGPGRAAVLGAPFVLLGPLADAKTSGWEASADLRRLAYSLCRRGLREELLEPGGGRFLKDVDLKTSLDGELHVFWSTWPAGSRLRVFLRSVEHNLVVSLATKEQESCEAPEVAVWDDAEGNQGDLDQGFVRVFLMYVLSLNLRRDGKCIKPHELDSLLCLILLSLGSADTLCDARSKSSRSPVAWKSLKGPWSSYPSSSLLCRAFSTSPACSALTDRLPSMPR